MPKSYPFEFRLRAIALVRAGKSIAITASELGISKGTLYTWVNQDLVDHGKRAGLTTREHGELVAAQRRIRELETELAVNAN